MADTPTRLFGPIALPATPTTYYTVPGGQVALRMVHVANESNVDATFTISVSADTAGRRLWYNTKVAAGTTFDWNGMLCLIADPTNLFGGSDTFGGGGVFGSTDTLIAYGTPGNALSLTVAGVVVN